MSGQNFRMATVLQANSDFRNPTIKRTERLMRRLNHAVIGVSEEVCNNYRMAIGASPIPILIPNAIDLARFQFDEETRRAIRKDVFHVNDLDRVLIQVGRIAQQKQQLLTMSAVRQISATLDPGVRFKLVFVGTTEPQEYTHRFFENLKQSFGNVTVEYFGARSDIRDLLMGADLSVMPSSGEAHSLAALEAAASGIQLVLSDIVAFEELSLLEGVYSFRSGDYVSLAAMMTKAMKTGLPRFKRNLNKYSIDRCCDSYTKVVRRMMGTEQTE